MSMNEECITNREENNMARISARLIGKQIGKNAHEVNLMLEKIGFITKGKYVTKTGLPTWDITALGKLHGELSNHPYSHGHIWDQEVSAILKKTFKL